MLLTKALMQILDQGYCPFRVEVGYSQAGCKLRLGKESLCYTQEVRPLVHCSDTSRAYYCPLLNFALSNETYNEIKQLVKVILSIQDEESVGINIWPMLTGVADPRHNARTKKGIKMQQVSKRVREELEEIIYGLY